MKRRGYLKLLVLTMCMAYPHIVFSAENDPASQLEIVTLLQQWPQDFNAKNVHKACGLFASDLIASYPGTADRNYKEMCSHLTTSLTDPNTRFHYEPPKIEQILINGDLAVVRLIWTLKISYKNRTDTDVIKEKGLDVFKRQKDGSWKIAISYAYPIGA